MEKLLVNRSQERELIKGKKSKKYETPKIENKEPLISNSVNKFTKDNETYLKRYW